MTAGSGWLEGKVALVTGASSGIGRAIVERFAAEGARVGAMARSADRLNELAAAWPAQVIAMPGDVTRLANNQAAVEATLKRFGRLDVFVGNAGIFDGFASLRAMPREVIEPAFDDVFAVNVKGLLFGAKAAEEALRTSHGCMIFTVSQAGQHPAGGGPIYTASKHAAVGLVRQLAHELAPEVRVNGVSPGGTVSDIAIPRALEEVCRGRLYGEARAEAIRHRNPLRRAQLPEDHTAVYVLLASDQSPAMTGAIVETDGGIGVRGVPVYD